MYLQWSNQTKANRFPKIFARAVELQPTARRIMSFGCSTGEECFTLAELFPKAETIVGIDVNTGSIYSARAKNKDERIFFHDHPGATGVYDLVMSLMVLFSIWQPVKEEEWLETVKLIDKHVNEDGVWIIYTSQFPLSKAEDVYKGYHVIKEWARTHPKDKNKYYCGYYRKKKR